MAGEDGQGIVCLQQRLLGKGKVDEVSSLKSVEKLNPQQVPSIMGEEVCQPTPTV